MRIYLRGGFASHRIGDAGELRAVLDEALEEDGAFARVPLVALAHDKDAVLGEARVGRHVGRGRHRARGVGVGVGAVMMLGSGRRRGTGKERHGRGGHRARW